MAIVGTGRGGTEIALSAAQIQGRLAIPVVKGEPLGHLVQGGFDEAAGNTGYFALYMGSGILEQLKGFCMAYLAAGSFENKKGGLFDLVNLVIGNGC